MRILMFGPQAAGKGTQAEKIQKEYGIKPFSTGQLFREHLSNKTEYAAVLQGYMSTGRLVPDMVVNEILFASLKGNTDFLLDGYPRNHSQAEFILSKFTIDAVIALQLPDDEAVNRIAARRICSKCQATYNIVSKKPKIDGICDRCGGDVVLRDDDKPEQTRVRLEEFHNRTEPILDFYKQKGVPIFHIDGNRSIDEVWHDIKEKLEYLIGSGK